MGPKRFPYKTLEPLVREHLFAPEDDRTALLCKRFRVARRRGYLTQGEFVEACLWKSARPIKHVRSNTHHRVRAATSVVLATRSERARLEALLGLKGVSVPTASAILMFLDPKRYGVIDIRAWKVLHAEGAVTANEKGTHFTVEQWLQFLGILRDLSTRLAVTARQVELALFDAHRARQEGTLYG
jgi:hypothetical protein